MWRLISIAELIGVFSVSTSKSLTSLYDLVSEADETLLLSSNVTYDNISKAKIGKNGLGLILTDDISFDLKTGDRFFTMNDVNIFNITQEEWSQFKVSTAFPVEAVVMRSRSRVPSAGKVGWSLVLLSILAPGVM